MSRPSPFPIDLGGDASLCAETLLDAEEMFALVDAERSQLRQWLPWVDATTDVESIRNFLREVEAGVAAGSSVTATIRLGGDLAGTIDLRINPAHQRAEVGYWLAAAYQGRGLVTRAVAALIDLAFGPLGLHRFQLSAATGNTRSRAVAERLGMRHEGTLREAERIADRFVDLEVYAVLAPVWRARTR